MQEKTPTSAHTNPESWLKDHGDALYRYAFSRLRDAAQSEDLVQETLVAAFQGRHGFSGRSAERTWLIGILKNKLVDYLRKHAREVPAGDMTGEDLDTEAMFDSSEHWKTPPSEWENPARAMEQKQFWKVMSECLGALPSRHARVFSLCELEGFDSTEACKVVGITTTNLWVLLHRARLRLRQCLENRWFGKETSE
jgi:RNA polymerase sigma-70 factor (ECF subfamily)